MQEMKNNQIGITLIALVITIIVLLILAGISIATLTGDNGVLNKASDSKIVSALGTAKDEINLKVQEAMSDYYESIYVSNESSKFSNEGIVNEIMQKLKTNFDGKESNDYIISTGGISEGATIVVQSKAQPSLRIVGTIQENGTISWTDKFKKSEPVESIGLAKDILTLTEIDSETIDSPYVNYPSAKGTIKCKVLYNDNDEKGLQIVSVDPVTKVELGKNDPNPNVTGVMGSLERGQNSYNRAITTLNEKAEEYKGTSDGSILTVDARCIGSDPINKNNPENITEIDEKNSEMVNLDYTYMANYNGKYFKSDTHYSTDVTRLTAIGAYDYKNVYWLASHRVAKISTNSIVFYIRIYFPTLGLNSYSLWEVDTSGTASSNRAIFDFRPVFKLSPEVKIIGGEGTEEVPYEIGI